MVNPLVVVQEADGDGGMGAFARGDHPRLRGVARIAVAP
jgi:hypothetical protein